MRVLVTGASGYIGKCLVQTLCASHDVITATRKPVDQSSENVTYDFRDRAFLLPPAIDILVHLAANTGVPNEVSAEQEILSATELASQAQKCGIFFIFLSSQTAVSDSRSLYGATKLAIEKIVIEAGGVVIRPGQVYGGQETGLFGYLVNFLRRSPFIPVFFPAPKVQPIHVLDLCGSINHAMNRTLSGAILNVGAEIPISFNRFLHAIACHRVRKYRFPVPVPSWPISFFGRLLGPKYRKRLGVERLYSLVTLKPMPTAESLSKIDVRLRALASGMHSSGSGSRRLLIQEGKVLLSYVLGVRVPLFLVRRYVRVIELDGTSHAFGHCALLNAFPKAMSLLDNESLFRHKSFAPIKIRLGIAIKIAEASPLGAIRYIFVPSAGSKLLIGLALARIITIEVVLKLARMLLKPFFIIFASRQGDVP